MLGVRWMLVILHCCVSSHAFLHRSPRGNKEDQPKPPCLSNQSHDPVFVPCPNVTADDATFKLLKGENVVCQLGATQIQCNQSELKVQLIKHEQNRSVGFNLHGACQGTYRCEGTIIYPPPVRTVESNQRIVIVTEDPQRSCKERTNPPTEESKDLLWIWITAVTLLSVYGLVITIVALVIWSKLQGADYQNDYMNTKPVAPQNRRKKKGLLTPIPRYI